MLLAAAGFIARASGRVGHVSPQMMKTCSHVRRQAHDGAAAALAPTFDFPTNTTLEPFDADLTVPKRPRHRLRHNLTTSLSIIHSYANRAIAIGNKLEVLQDYPVPKGCTSPFAPTWIAYILEHGSSASP